jgi:hypothetical protein
MRAVVLCRNFSGIHDGRLEKKYEAEIVHWQGKGIVL